METETELYTGYIFVEFDDGSGHLEHDGVRIKFANEESDPFNHDFVSCKFLGVRDGEPVFFATGKDYGVKGRDEAVFNGKGDLIFLEGYTEGMGYEDVRKLFEEKTQTSEMPENVTTQDAKTEQGEPVSRFDYFLLRSVSPEDMIREIINEFAENFSRIAVVAGEGLGDMHPMCPPQNWNGRLYQGPAAAMLAAKSLDVPRPVPVFLNRDQLWELGLEPKGEGTSILTYSMEGEIQSGRVWSLSETDFPLLYPDYYKEIKGAIRADQQMNMSFEDFHDGAKKMDADVLATVGLEVPDGISAEGKSVWNAKQQTLADICHLLVSANLGVSPTGLCDSDAARDRDSLKKDLLAGRVSYHQIYNALCSTGQKVYKTCRDRGILRQDGIDMNALCDRITAKFARERRQDQPVRSQPQTPKIG